MKKLNLNVPRMGNIIVFKGDNSWICRQIKKSQKKLGFTDEDSSYSHVAVSGGGPYIVDVAMPRTKVIDMRKKYKGRYIKVLEYTADDYAIKRYKIAFWSSSLNNLGYDFLGVLKFRIGFIFHKANKFFCSENVAWSIQKEYPKLFHGLASHKIMPADFLSFEFRTIWEGILE